MPQTTDRQLLFGILAVQLDLISRDDLLVAASMWMTDKTRPLGSILVEQGALDDDSRQLLDRLVQKHVEGHDRDEQASLAAVDRPQAVDEQLLQLDDPDIERALKTHEPAQVVKVDAEVTVPPETNEPPDLRFVRVRFHDGGGLGEIYVAKDNQVERDVALKEIRPKFADHGPSRQKFLEEARITGNLEHPGVVPVYGLGQYADGRPYYAMQFIRGSSLKSAIALYHKRWKEFSPGERELEFRNLLQRFIDVCNVIEYAHHRHVVHRDLKPENIMLGKFGETLVVDWGLAVKVRGAVPSDSTRYSEQPLPSEVADEVSADDEGKVVGTPAFMSPEQAMGRVSEVDGRSDIYSLGATLFQILTGKPPLLGEKADVLRRTREGDVPEPRDVFARVPRQLNAVVKRAMATSRGDRYASAASMAADVERWLADEPVSVYDEHVFERARRWMRRHKSWTAAIAGSLVLITIVSVIAAIVVDQAREEAEVARDEAQQLFVMARSSADKLLFNLSDELELMNATTQTRERLLTEAERMFQELAGIEPSDPQLVYQAALSHLRLGIVRRELRRLTPSLDSFQEAQLMLEELSQEGDVPQYRFQLARVHTERGRTLNLTSAADANQQAKDEHQNAVLILDRLLEDEPDNEEYARVRASARINLAVVLGDAEELPAAERELQQAIETLERLAAAPGVDERSRRRYLYQLARSTSNLGELMNRQGQRFDEACRAYETSRGYAAELLQYDSLVPAYRERDAMAHLNLADAHAARNGGPGSEHRDLALELYQLALDKYELLADDNVRVPEYRASCISCRRGLAYLQDMRLEDRNGLERDVEALRDVLMDQQDRIHAYDVAQGMLTLAEDDLAAARSRLDRDGETAPAGDDEVLARHLADCERWLEEVHGLLEADWLDRESDQALDVSYSLVFDLIQLTNLQLEAVADARFEGQQGHADVVETLHHTEPHLARLSIEDRASFHFMIAGLLAQVIDGAEQAGEAVPSNWHDQGREHLRAASAGSDPIDASIAELRDVGATERTLQILQEWASAETAD